MSEKDIQKGYDLGYAEGLVHGKLEGADEAEERIIKLLEDSCSCVEQCYCTLNKAYDLIKGEQK